MSKRAAERNAATTVSNIPFKTAILSLDETLVG
jgi:hypothetical protein